MEQASFGQLGKDIISLVELASLGKWPEAEAMQKKAMSQLGFLMGDPGSSCCGSLLASELTTKGRWKQAEILLRELCHLANRNPDVRDMVDSTLSSMFERKSQEAEEMRMRERLRIQGEQHPDVLRSMNNLALVLQKQAKWKEAEEMHREVLRMSHHLLGEDHPNTLSSGSYLALVLQEQGKWQVAEEMHREVLEARRRVLGEKDPDTLVSMNNLANVLQSQGKWQEAEDMHREALEVQRKVLGQEHQNTLASMNNLGIVLRAQAQWQEAEEMQREALEVQRRVLGLEHQNTLASMNNLASVLQEQGMWEEAEEMHRKALEVRRRVLGQEHHDTLGSMNNLAIVLQEQGMWEEAAEMHIEVLEGMRRVLGKEHQNTLSSMYNLATVLQELGKWQEAEEMHREVLEVRCQVLGEGHPNTLSSRSYLAFVLQEQGKWQEAEEIHREVLEVRCQVLGQQHADTLVSRNNLANVLQSQGKWQEAEEMHREVLEDRRRVLGEEHPDTLISMTNLANVLVMRDRDDWAYRFQHLDKDTHQSRFNVAVKHVRSAIAALEKAKVAEDHPHLLSYRSYLAELLVQANEGNLLLEVEHLLQQVIPGLSNRFGVDDARAQRAIATLVSLLEEQGREKDADQWRQHLLEAQHDDDVRERDTKDWRFRYSMSSTSHSERVTDAIDKLRRAIEALKPRVDDEHPQLLEQNRALAKLLLQINDESSLNEAQNLLLQLVPALQERYGSQHPVTQEAIGDLVFLLEEHGKDAKEWRQQLSQIETATDRSAVPFADENLSGEDWEGREETAKLLRDLLGKPFQGVRKAIASSEAISAAALSSPRSQQVSLSHSVASEAAQSCASFDDASSSDDGLAFFRAAADKVLKERAERAER